MILIVIRHGKVNYKWSKWCNSAEYDKECIEYDVAPIKNGTFKVPEIRFQNIYISTLSRSRDTAIKIFSKDNLTGNFTSTEWIDEVPLKSSFDTGLKLPLWFWNLTGSIQWFMDRPRQTEGRRDTKKRAGLFVELLLEKGVDSAIVTHGFYMHTLLWEMKKAGFRIKGSHIYYENGDCVVAKVD